MRNLAVWAPGHGDGVETTRGVAAKQVFVPSSFTFTHEIENFSFVLLYSRQRRRRKLLQLNIQLPRLRRPNLTRRPRAASPEKPASAVHFSSCKPARLRPHLTRALCLFFKLTFPSLSFILQQQTKQPKHSPDLSRSLLVPPPSPTHPPVDRNPRAATPLPLHPYPSL